MQVMGIDLGFSPKEKTSCYCAFKVDTDTKEIGFLLKPAKFNYRDKNIINMIRNNYFDVITLDAPMTPKHFDEAGLAKPETGRMIEKAFSVDIFHSSKRGPQPSSIAVPKQGWPFYCAGMQFASDLKPYQYLSLNDIQKGNTVGIYEVIPKLTQTLLVPREVLVNRNDQIDNYLFPILFQNNSQYRCLINSILNEFYFSSEVECYIRSISNNIKTYHEELAAFVCAFQALLINIGKASIIGFDGDYEAYYALPNTAYWHQEWLDCFNRKSSVKFQSLKLFEKGILQTRIVSRPSFNKSLTWADNSKANPENIVIKSSATSKSTVEGYINKNNQKNLGKTDQRGSGNLQWFYQMKCLDCGYTYFANGHDIWLRKCPTCQGGQP
jgi:hypothetical protein